MAQSGPHHESGRDIARRVLERVFREQAYLSLALDAELARRDVAERERALATEIAYGVCRHLTRLDRALLHASARGKLKVKLPVRTAMRVGAYQLLFLDRVPAHAAVDDAVGAARRAAGAQVAAFVNSVLRRLADAGEPAMPEPAADAASAVAHARDVHSMPEWIARRVLAQHPDLDQFLAAIAALGQRAPLVVRGNRRRIDPDQLAALLTEERPGVAIERSRLAPDALALDRFGDPARSPAFARGLFTVQDVAAQLVGHLACAPAASDPEATSEIREVLDACAGVGGKSTHLAELLAQRPDTRIHAVDISAAKLERLRAGAERLGVSGCIHTSVADLISEHPAALGASYDLVLLDAPCTGLGVLRRHPEAKWRVTEPDVATMVATQRALLDQVSARVRPGGLLVYSVCTFTREEGPDQVAAFLARHPEFALDPPAAPAAPDGPGSAIPWPELAADPAHGPAQIATWPHRHHADAFFAARLRRRVAPS